MSGPLRLIAFVLVLCGGLAVVVGMGVARNVSAPVGTEDFHRGHARAAVVCGVGAGCLFLAFLILNIGGSS